MDRTENAFEAYEQRVSPKNLGKNRFARYKNKRQEYLESVNLSFRRLWSRLALSTKSVSTLPDAGNEQHDLGKHKDWDDWHWHVTNRVRLNSASTHQDVVSTARQLKLSSEATLALRKAVLDGVVELTNAGHIRRHFDFSLLPLNTLLPDHVREYFLPQSDYGKDSATKKQDPYGLVWAQSSAMPDRPAQTSGVFVYENNRPHLIGTQKFPHTLLLNIDYYCPIGCADCYKTRLGTREDTFFDTERKERSDAPIYIGGPKGTVVSQAKQRKRDLIDRVKHWLTDTERGHQVYDVILSGGEPLMLSDNVLERTLREVASAPQIQNIRICTGTLFMGLPFRITDAMTRMISEVVRDTGVKISVHCHIISKHQITPEAIVAVQRLRQSGINIYSQTPIKKGINFYTDDINSTISEFAEMYRLLVACGVDPYMMIADMHPTTIQQYVPIEQMLLMWGRLVESHQYPGTERPRTLSVLYEQGNIILSGSSLFAARKTVHKDQQIVTYEFPQVGPGPAGELQVDKWQRYEEPLLPGNSDPYSLDRIRDKIRNEP